MELCSLPAIYLGPNYGGGNEGNGDPPLKIPGMYCYSPCPQPCSRPPWTHAFARDSWTPTGKSPMGSLFLSPGSWCTRFCCALQESISQSCVSKFWQLYSGVNGNLLQEGLCHTHTQSPRPCSRPLLTCTSQEMLKHRSVSVSVGSLGPGTHEICLSPLRVSGRNGV